MANGLMIQMNRVIVLVIRCPMVTWWPATMMPVPMNGFIILVWALRSRPRANGIVRNALPQCAEEIAKISKQKLCK